MSIIHFLRSFLAGAMLFVPGISLIFFANRIAKDNRRIREEELNKAKHQTQNAGKLAQAKVVFLETFLPGGGYEKELIYVIGLVVMVGGVVVFIRYMIG